MAAATHKTGGRKGSVPKTATRARRIAVAKAKSGPRAKAAAKAAADVPRRRSAPAEPAPVQPRVKAAKPAPRAAAPAPSRAPRKRRPAAPAVVAAREIQAETLPPADAPLTDEERIESAKYTPRGAAPRVFEEERFLFPQTYGVNRLRLLVKDPEWLFVYWDVDPRAMESLRADLGERASALSQLTLRIFEDGRGGTSMFLVPQDARTWYVPTRSGGRAYRAEVGVMLPSGEFRPLAQSDSVVTPRGEGSSQKARRRVRYDRARSLAPGGLPAHSDDERAVADQPWEPPIDAGAGPEETRPRTTSRGEKTVERGGASDLHRR